MTCYSEDPFISTKVSFRSRHSLFSVASAILVRSMCVLVKALEARPSSAADRGCSEMIHGIKRASKGFITSSDAQMIATLISMDEKTIAKVPHPAFVQVDVGSEWPAVTYL